MLTVEFGPVLSSLLSLLEVEVLADEGTLIPNSSNDVARRMSSLETGGGICIGLREERRKLRLFVIFFDGCV